MKLSKKKRERSHSLLKRVGVLCILYVINGASGNTHLLLYLAQGIVVSFLPELWELLMMGSQQVADRLTSIGAVGHTVKNMNQWLRSQ